MKHKFDYKRVVGHGYDKVCVCCGESFVTSSKNKRYCDDCSEEISRRRTNDRVKKYNRRFAGGCLGTGFYLNGCRVDDDFCELDLVLDEMRFHGLL